MMARVTAEVRALLQERQDQRKAALALDAHRRDVRFAAGDEVLLDTEHTPLLSRSLLSPPLDGPLHRTCMHGARHVPPRHPRRVARLPGVQY
jgi:hypothetical protein